MTREQSKRLTELRTEATSGRGNLMSEEQVKELRQLEHIAAVEFAKKHGMTLHIG